MWTHRLVELIKISNSQGIARRFFVTNGFDGSLTMLGLYMGFYLSGDASVHVALQAGVGAAIALFMSGSTSAFISESAERRKEISELEGAMNKDLTDSLHGQAAKVIPAWVALVNGLSPLLISLFIMSPLWFSLLGFQLPGNLFLWPIGLSGFSIFLLGIYLSTISQSHWFMSGIKALCIAIATLLVIYLVGDV